MKIERDKVYLTRCGEKVRVVCVDVPGKFPVIVLDGGGMTYRVPANGVFRYDGKEGPSDLVSEYVEPPKPREVWVHFGTYGNASCAWSAYEIDNLSEPELSELPPLVKFREVIE